MSINVHCNILTSGVVSFCPIAIKARLRWGSTTGLVPSMLFNTACQCFAAQSITWLVLPGFIHRMMRWKPHCFVIYARAKTSRMLRASVWLYLEYRFLRSLFFEVAKPVLVSYRFSEQYIAMWPPRQCRLIMAAYFRLDRSITITIRAYRSIFCIENQASEAVPQIPATTFLLVSKHHQEFLHDPLTKFYYKREQGSKKDQPNLDSSHVEKNGYSIRLESHFSHNNSTRIESQSMTRVRVVFAKSLSSWCTKQVRLHTKKWGLFALVMIKVGGNFLFCLSSRATLHFKDQGSPTTHSGRPETAFTEGSVGNNILTPYRGLM